jgi:hypothetical protein
VGTAPGASEPLRAGTPLRCHVAVWLARAAWLLVALAGGAAVGDALAEHSRAVQLTGTALAWAGWAAGAVALAVLSVVTLTMVRVVVPASLVVAAVMIADRSDATGGIALAAPAAAATALVASAEFGRRYLQASAYGAEARFGLRPPLGYLAASTVTWLAAVIAATLTPLAWAAQAWVPAVLGSVALVAAARLLPRRWHQLSRRWFVFVPAGLVVHDPVLLTDTLMVRRELVDAVELDDRGVPPPGGADLTGPTPGLAVEVRLREPVTAALAPTARGGKGSAIELAGFVVSPSRPGSVVRTARALGYGTGVTQT